MEERIHRWENHSEGTLASIRASTHDDTGLALNVWNRPEDGLDYIAVSGRSRLIDRTPELIRRQELGTVALAIVTHGEAFFHDRRGTQILRAGDAVLYNMDAPFVLGCSANMAELMLNIPHGRLENYSERRIEGAEVVRTRAGDVRHTQKETLSTLIRSMSTTADEPSLGQDTVLSLVELLICDGRSTSAGYCATARTFIASNLGDEELTPAAIAAHVGLSERHLGRIFAEDGTTLTREIRNQRVESAARFLAEDSTHASMGQVARRFGFVSQSHFNRVFRERFERTPAQWRQEQQSRARS